VSGEHPLERRARLGHDADRGTAGASGDDRPRGADHERSQRDGFRHEALLYADGDELLAGTVPFLREGLEREEAMLVAMPRPNLSLLEGELGGEAERIQFVDMEELGRNPGRIISAWHDFVDEHLRPDRGVRGIGEPIWAARGDAEMDECMRHESLLNLAFGDGPAWSLLCPYDTSALDDRALESAAHNHPVLRADGRARASAAYLPPEHPDAGPLAGELDEPEGVLAELDFDRARLRQVREVVAEHALRVGLSPGRTDALVLAASEVATNSLLHGGGEGKVLVWLKDGCFGCDVSDRGQIEQPLVGRRRPPNEQVGGHGLWLAHQLCDLVQIRSGATGSRVRLRMAI
jgi:anti-sigma regulatory factor (Ser/Thr protein kinase)